MLIDFLKTRRGIPFSQMFAMKEYPSDVMPLYSQGHSVSQWLIEQHGRRAFLDFLAAGMEDENWPQAVRSHYGFDNLYAMQNSWLDWVKAGRPQLTPDGGSIGQLASHTQGAGTPAQGAIYRGQSPDDVTPVGADETTSPGWVGVRASEVTPTESVYAAAAARAQVTRQRDGRTPEAVYDASRHTGTILR
jgi:hypothetical protein